MCTNSVIVRWCYDLQIYTYTQMTHLMTSYLYKYVRLRKCTLAALRDGPGWVTLSAPTHYRQMARDRRTDGRQTVTLSIPLDAVSSRGSMLWVTGTIWRGMCDYDLVYVIIPTKTIWLHIIVHDYIKTPVKPLFSHIFIVINTIIVVATQFLKSKLSKSIQFSSKNY